MDDVTKKVLAMTDAELQESLYMAFDVDCVHGDSDVEEAVERIAMCSTEALRLLLEAEYEGHPEGTCIWCAADSAGRFASPTHAEHCPWLALMKKAGLR